MLVEVTQCTTESQNAKDLDAVTGDSLRATGLSVFELSLLNPMVNWAKLRVGRGIKLSSSK